MNIIPRMSLNFNSRPLEPVSILVLHYTGMRTAEEALLRLCDPESNVSAHYVVEEDGTIWQLVEEEMRAWHAGVSYWRGRENINDISIGVEIVNPGHEFGYRPFPSAQMEAVAALSRDIIERHHIPARNVVAHSDIAPERKEDPGELFDWAWLAERGVGLWPLGGARGEGLEASKNEEVPRLLSYGYSTTHPDKTILAFQRHFRPAKLTGVWDGECQALLDNLLEMM